MVLLGGKSYMSAFLYIYIYPQYLTDDLFKISEVARRRAPQSNTMLILQHCKVVYLITDYCFRIAEGRQLKC